MLFSITLVITILLIFILRAPLKRFPWLFYGLSVIATIAFFTLDFIPLPIAVGQTFFLLMQKCIVAVSLFIVVMYIGVFDVKSQIRSWLQPVRAELSIIACILALGHVVAYLTNFGVRVLFSDASYNIFLVASVCVALILFALLLILGITSFEFLKRRMKTKTWKGIQALAYLFYLLIYAHILLCLLPPALSGGVAAQVSVALYSALFVLYAICKVRRKHLDAKQQNRLSCEQEYSVSE